MAGLLRGKRGFASGLAAGVLALLGMQAAAGVAPPVLVSATAVGVAGNYDSYEGAVTPNGRIVAFDSGSTNLGTGYPTSNFQIFLLDRKTGDLAHISRSPDGSAAGNGASYCPCISANGRWTAYYSNASNLVAGDLDATDDLFVYDKVTGQTTMYPFNSDGVLADGRSQVYGNALTPNGRWLVFYSQATNLLPGVGGGYDHVYLLDLKTGSLTLVSADDAGNPGNALSRNPSISPNGKWVVFESNATNLVPGDGNGLMDVFVRDLKHGKTRRISVPDAGGEADGISMEAVVSNSGQVVAFRSNATNLVASDTNGKFDIFVRDDRAGTTVRIDQNGNGDQATGGHAYEMCMSASGSTIAYYSYATNLVAGVSSPSGGAYLYDRRKKTTRQLDLGPAGELPDGFAYLYAGSMTPSGKWLTMASVSSLITPAGSGGRYQMYLVQLK